MSKEKTAFSKCIINGRAVESHASFDNHVNKWRTLTNIQRINSAASSSVVSTRAVEKEDSKLHKIFTIVNLFDWSI
jgi:hypothetical protein